MTNRDEARNKPLPNPVMRSRCMTVADDPFVAVGLLTETNIRMLGTSLRQVFPIPEDHKFDELLQALDQAVEGKRASG